MPEELNQKQMVIVSSWFEDPANRNATFQKQLRDGWMRYPWHAGWDLPYTIYQRVASAGWAEDTSESINAYIEQLKGEGSV